MSIEDLRAKAERTISAAESLAVPSATVPESKARTLGEWMSNPALLEPPLTVIPYLAMEGRVTLISGREKIGKSTFVAGAIASASRGDDVLGRPVHGRVKTLHYPIDEPMGDTVRRYSALGADAHNIVLNPHPRTVTDFLAAVAIDVATYEPHNVMVDTLSKLFDNSGVDRNAAKDVGPVMNRIVDFFHEKGIACELLYHTGKAGREYSGNTIIGATVDEVLTLRRRGQSAEDDFETEGSDDGRRLLVQDGRNLRGRVHLTYVDGLYQLYEDTQPPKAKLIDVLRINGPVKSRSELVKLSGVRKATGLAAIAELILEGEITESVHGLSIGSERFPEGGTITEPGEVTTQTSTLFTGSRNGDPHLAQTGTIPAKLSTMEEFAL